MPFYGTPYDMASTKPAAGLHFVVSTGVEKPDPELRKFIRSHVMLGKNKGKAQRPRKRVTKELQNDSSSSSCVSNPSAASGQDGDMVEPSASSTKPSHTVLPVTVPRKFGSQLDTICFADAVEPVSVEVVLQFSSIAKKVMFPRLESYILFERRADNWIAPLIVDPAYLHLMIFTSQYYFDAILPRKFTPLNERSLPHFLETLRLLRKRIAQDDDQVRLSLSTAATVMGLAGYAQIIGDSKSARHHMEGLCRIVSLRGGITTFRDNGKLLLEIFRVDLGAALHSGSMPAFFNHPSCREPILPYPDLSLLLKTRGSVANSSTRRNSTTFLDDMDDELARAWKVMSEFCSVINFAVDSAQRISTETYLDAMTSVMYRLFDMHFEAGSSDEAIRLGLLAFSTSVFLQWQHLGMPYPHFSATFRGCLATLTSSSHITLQLLVWLLMVGAVSVFDAADDEWLKPLLLVNTRHCEIDCWSKMRDLLDSFMWIALLQDGPGKAVFDSTITYIDTPLLDLSRAHAYQ